ncbi:MAG: hypothetical protein H6625_09195 [Bdellovibrionaceae bacterium]|nr:hypothetical protein [Pseudobdellovibrionaceae bacterium]
MGKVFKNICITLLVFALGLGAFWYLGRGFIENHIKEKIIANSSPYLQGFALNKVKLYSIFPFQMKLDGIQFQYAGLEVTEISSINILAELKNALWDRNNNLNVKMEVDSVQIQKELSLAAFMSKDKVEGVAATTAEPSGSKLTPLFLPLLALPWPIHLDFFLNSGSFKILGPDKRSLLELSAIQLSGKQAPFLDTKAPVLFNVKTQLQSDWLGLSYKLPIQISTSESYFVDHKISAKKLDFSVSGINMTFNEGYSDFSKNEHYWDTQIDIKDLSQLPSLPDFLPAGQWKGAIQGKVQLKKVGVEPLFVDVALSSTPIQGQVQVEQDKLKLSGTISTQFQTKFNYKNKFKLESLKGYLDLEQASVQQGQFFDKPTGIPMKAEVDIQYNEGLLLVKKMNALFYKLKTTMSGNLSQDNKNSSSLKIQVPNTDLSGFEQFIPIAKSAPMKGQIGLQALVEGNIGKLNALILNVEDFHLKNLSALIDYMNTEKGFSINGPFQLDASGNLIFEKMLIKNANFSFKTNGDQLDFKVANNMTKKKGSLLRVSANLQQQNKKMTLKETMIKSPGIDLVAYGDIYNEDLTKFEIKTKLNEFNKAELEKVLPFLTNFETQPVARGNLNIKGALDPKLELQDQAFEISGGLFVKIPVYKVQSKVQAPGEQPIQVEAAAPVAYLPDWPMFRKANLQVKSYVDHFYFDNVHLTNISSNSFLKGGILSATGQVSGAYGGKIFIDSLKFNALKSAPESLVALRIKDLQTTKALSDLLDKYQGESNGILDMTLRGRIPYPYGREWHSGILAKGSLELRNAKLPTFAFDKMAGDALANAPGIGSKEQVLYAQNNYKINTQYSMAKDKVLLTNFNILSAEGGQFTSNGTVDVDLNCNFFGDVFLTKAPVRGSVFAANRDNKLRFTTPISIKGTLLSSSASVSREELDRILSNAIRFEANKTQIQSRKALEDAATKSKKDLDNKTKKKINSLFEIK